MWFSPQHSNITYLTAYSRCLKIMITGPERQMYQHGILKNNIVNNMLFLHEI